MVSVIDLWLPILVATGLVFVASFIMHMVLPHHKSDFRPVPNEDGFLDWLRSNSVQAGAYFIPHCTDWKEVNTNPELKAKFEKGPHGLMYIWPGMGSMPVKLVLTALFFLLTSVFVGYITGEARAADAPYLEVFQISGCVAIVAYVFGFLQRDIWYTRPGANTLKDVVDGVVYGLLTAGVFSWLWPSAAAVT